MADTAFKQMYRDEFIAAFEVRQSVLRKTVTTEAQINGQQATFLVAGSGGATAVTRGVNGLIPARAPDLNQYTATLVEWHDLERRNRFNIYASQGDGRRIMQMNTVGTINRKIDEDIVTELNTATQNTGAAVTGSLQLVLKAKTILRNNKVRGRLTGLITPAMHAYLMQTSEFGSADYVARKPFEMSPTDSDFEMFSWAEVDWIVHPELPGAGTNAEKCFMYHKSAIGHACDLNSITTAVGYDEEQDYSFARATTFMGSKLLQSSGVLVINHDGSALVAA